MWSNAVIPTNTGHYIHDIRACGNAHIGHHIGKRDTHGEHAVGCVFDKLGGLDATHLYSVYIKPHTQI